ncbi:MAG: glycoside hydrolase family 140 protein [Marinilabiliales bacterium]|nr:glycoside hydrolase family 140 protein [Marinilabiliales bacterium]
MKKILLSLIFVWSLSPVFGQVGQHGPLRVTENGHYLEYRDGTPFFWLGDTAWELFHRLTMEEIERYLDNRKAKGFNVIQAVVLAEMDGLQKPNRYGEVPFHHLDPSQPNENYFQLVDSVVQMAQRKGLFMGLLPTWGDKVTLLWGKGPVVFNAANAYDYGLWIGRRYKKYSHVIWILGGDRPAMKDSVDWRPVWRSMAKGLLEGSGPNVLIAYHPWGGELSSSQYIHTEPWLTLNMMQSGHGSGHDVEVWKMVERDWNLLPAKPTLDAEPNYEDHPVNPWPKWDPANGYYRDYDVRKQTYRSVFAGACGVTYGHHSIWQFWSPREEPINHADRYWTEALDRPGAFQVGYLRRLMESRPLSERIPDDRLIETGEGVKGEYMTAFRDRQGRYLMVYLPVGRCLTVNSSSLQATEVVGWWFDPKSGKATLIGRLTNTGHITCTPPTLGVGHDWVLVLDDPKARFAEPGQATK